MKSEIQRLKKDIQDKVERLAQVADGGFNLEAAKRENWSGEARTKLAFLDLITAQAIIPLPSVDDFAEKY